MNYEYIVIALITAFITITYLNYKGANAVVHMMVVPLAMFMVIGATMGIETYLL